MNENNHLTVTTSWDDGHKCDLVLKQLLDKYHLKGTFYATQSYLVPLDLRILIDIDQTHEISAYIR